MIIIVINAIFVPLSCPRIFSARLMDWVDKSISFSFSAHLFLPFFPSASVSFSYSFSRAFPPASSLGREQNATTRKPRAFRYARVRSIGRPVYVCGRKFQCARIYAVHTASYGAHNALVTKSFRRSLSPKLFYRREKSLRNERRLHAVDHSGS